MATDSDGTVPRKQLWLAFSARSRRARHTSTTKSGSTLHRHPLRRSSSPRPRSRLRRSRTPSRGAAPRAASSRGCARRTASHNCNCLAENENRIRRARSQIPLWRERSMRNLLFPELKRPSTSRITLARSRPLSLRKAVRTTALSTRAQLCVSSPRHNLASSFLVRSSKRRSVAVSTGANITEAGASVSVTGHLIRQFDIGPSACGVSRPRPIPEFRCLY
jgi:hypothetical protein